MTAADLEALEEQEAKLRNAVRALGSLTREPQERLDRALSYFTRTFRDVPDGPAGDLYRRVYAAIGDPPPGTTISVDLGVLRPDELDDLAEALVELHQLYARACVAAKPAA